MRTTSIVLAGTLLASLLAPLPAHAAPRAAHPSQEYPAQGLIAGVEHGPEESEPLGIAAEAAVGSADGPGLEAALLEENLLLEDLRVDEDGRVVLEVAVDHESSAGTVSELVIDFDEASAEIEVSGEFDGEPVEDALDVRIGEFSPELVVFDSTDADGEQFGYRSDTVYPSFVPAIPIGVAIGAAAFKALAATTAVVVVAGATYVAAGEAIKAIRKKKPKYSHFRAVISGKGLYIGNGMTRAAAVTWGKRGKDVWSTSRSGAKTVAGQVNPSCGPVGPEIDKNKKGKYYHFHPCKRTPKMHSFYGTAQ